VPTRRKGNSLGLLFRFSDVGFGLFKLWACQFESAAVRADDFDWALVFIEKVPVRLSATE